MKKITTLLSIVLMLALCTMLFASCSEQASEETSSSETTSEETTEDASTSEDTSATEEVETYEPLPVREAGLYDGETAVDVDAIMTVEGVEIPYESYRYYYLSNRYMFDYGDTSVWNMEGEDMDAVADQLKEATEIGVLSSFAINKIAADNNIELTQEDLDFIDSEIELLIESVGGEETYLSMLESQYYTEELYRELFTNSILANKVIEVQYGDAIIASFNENYVRAQHILIPFTDATAEDHSEDLEVAEGVMERINAGEDFEALREEFNNDPGQPDEGYYFTTGEMVVEFEEAAFALEDNAISEIVETSYGYHIIRRLPMEESYIEDALVNYMTTEMIEEFSADLDEASSSLNVEYSEYYDLVSPKNVY